jgi:hypothetical protein
MPLVPESNNSLTFSFELNAASLKQLIDREICGIIVKDFESLDSCQAVLRSVRRQSFWVQRWPKLRESLAHLVGFDYAACLR